MDRREPKPKKSIPGTFTSNSTDEEVEAVVGSWGLNDVYVDMLKKKIRELEAKIEEMERNNPPT